ncbi:ATP-binding protein [Kitasatospora sp. NPDC097643]|uniref:ATP-binding protein n=1 Tax=Kitasatospora sp. NPDC097643 TaxID=3157230 RepID=UPI0033308D42
MSDSFPLRRPAPPPWLADPLVGRDEELAELLVHLTNGPLPRPRTLTLHGRAGVGTSALAARLAQDAGAALGWPVCWVPLWNGEFDPEATLARLLGRLGAPRRDLFRGDGVSFTSLVQNHLGGRPAVVVLDGVPSLESAEPLLQAFAATSAVIVLTTREDLSDRGVPTSFRGRIHAVSPLGPTAARELAGRVALGWDRPPADSESMSELIAAAQGLPRLLRIAVTLPEGGREGRVPRLGDPSPTGLVRLACAQVSEEARQVLGALEFLDAPVFDLATMARVMRRQVLRSLDETIPESQELLSKGLVHHLGVNRYVLTATPVVPSPSALFGRDPRVEHGRHGLGLIRRALERIDRAEPRSDAFGADGDLDQRMDEINTIVDRGSADAELDAQLLWHLAQYHALRGNAHDLIALRGAVSRLGTSQAEAVDLDRWLGVVARDIGELNRAKAHLARNPDQAWTDLAVLHVHQGLLNEVRRFTALCGADDGWSWLADAATFLEQGAHGRSVGTLAKAEEAHRAVGSGRGLAHARLHQGLLDLLRGSPGSANDLLHEADEVFHRIGDTRASAWVATGVGRAHHLQGDHYSALVALRSALDRHGETEDLRGIGWATYQRALVLADMGDGEQAWEDLHGALKVFRRLSDNVGVGWALHQLDWVERHFRMPDHSPGALLEAGREFEWAGCPRGIAWTQLELAWRGSQEVLAELVALAESGFAQLGDRAGLICGAFVRAALSGKDLRSAAGAAADALHAANPLFDDRLELWLSSGDWRRPELPRWARDFVVPTGTVNALAPHGLRRSGPGLALPGGKCQVRLALLDGHPTRVLLRVVPGVDHPWARREGELPWLSVVATPLTPAEVQPAGALLRPSADPARGAEFLLAPHRPGLHRFRFTIADEHTGTVLQVVETEIALTGLGDDPLDATPNPTHARRG